MLTFFEWYSQQALINLQCRKARKKSGTPPNPQMDASWKLKAAIEKYRKKNKSGGKGN